MRINGKTGVSFHHFSTYWHILRSPFLSRTRRCKVQLHVLPFFTHLSINLGALIFQRVRASARAYRKLYSKRTRGTSVNKNSVQGRRHREPAPHYISQNRNPRRAQ